MATGKRSNNSCDRCAKSSSPIRSSRTFRSRSTSSILAAALILASGSLAAATLEPVPTRDRRIIKRWSLSGSPRGLAIGADGTIYAGLAKPQSIVAINPKTGTILREVVLDSEEIASTKDFTSIRIDRQRERLIVAHGSDESVSILSLPDLKVLREIGLEGETIRDALPDPAGRYLYILGRTVHVFDADGGAEIKSLHQLEPMAIATDSRGLTLAVVGRQHYDNGPATSVALYQTRDFQDVEPEPLQTDRTIAAALFAADDRALVVLASDWLAEKPLVARAEKLAVKSDEGIRVRFEFGDFISSERICLPENAGPQIATIGKSSNLVVFAERRCSASGSFQASPRRVTASSLYAVAAHSIAYSASGDSFFATDPNGFLTEYKSPKK